MLSKPCGPIVEQSYQLLPCHSHQALWFFTDTGLSLTNSLVPVLYFSDSSSAHCFPQQAGTVYEAG
jgi:hypothetical protein